MSDAHRTDPHRPATPGIAIVGMAARFPGAENVAEFWQNLRDGVESIHVFTHEELATAGIDPATLNHPAYVRARGVLKGIERFDAAFFGFSPRETEIMDPQQRLFMECAWEALENAGCAPQTFDGPIGIYAGGSMSTYLLSNLYFNYELIQSVGEFQTMIANDKDHLTTRISYRLNLNGPSVNVQTACSTALVAVHLACQSLLNGECDAALAGGVCIGVPQERGYFYREGGIHSPDGHCRAFDARAQGTVGGNGVGVVVLKRLEDALAAGDRIRAVIRGSAINNDGSHKVGYTAPSVEGQAAVIAEALAVSGIQPETIGYIEAHGTATPLGDPIEIAALNEVFRAYTHQTGFCAIGSVKTNVGHLDAAAGAAGLIKTVLALEHKQIPPSLHFEQPNPQIDFADSPFFVNTQLVDWPSDGAARRAGVSSFGIGGTNAHLVLEEAPTIEPSSESRGWHVLPLSAKTETALAQAGANLAAHLRQHPDLNLADVAYTLAVGREAFNRRQVVIGRNVDEAAQALETRDPQCVFGYAMQQARERPVVFLFPGQGSQYVNMTRELYESESVFRKQIDACAELLAPHLGSDMRRILFPATERAEEAAQQLDQTAFTQPALFIVEYALAKLWMSWGVRPKAMIGHSLGEYVAACLAGVFSLDDALMLVAMRGRLTQQLPGGAVLSVPLSESELRPLLDDRLAIAAVNAPSLCAVSGPTDAIASLERRLAERGIEARRLHASHAFHSPMLDSIVEPFIRQVERVALKAPELPFVSNLTATWITAEEAADPHYWGRHLRHTVRFADGMAELLKDPERILLEVGPGRTLGTLAKQCADPARSPIAIASMRHPREDQSDVACLLSALGKLWIAGARVGWSRYYAGERRHRLPLPTYPFERQRYWVEPSGSPRPAEALQSDLSERMDAAEPTATPALSLHPRPALLTPYVAPASEIERQVAGIWQEVLGIERPGIHDNFFEAGGHSLMATQLVSRLREAFTVELPVRRLFEASTIAQLAETIEDAHRRGEWVSTSDSQAIPRRPASDSAPLSYAQQRLWFLDRLEPGNAAYNFPAAVRLSGSLDVAAMARSLNEIVQRHDSLRTTFPAIDGLPIQVIAPAQSLPLPLIDLEAMPADRREAEAHRIASEWAQAVFDLEHGPVVRVVLLQLTENEHALLLTMHHIVTDGWSMGVFVKEVATLYEAFSQGQPSPLPPLPIQYADFAVWQRDRLRTGSAFQTQLDHWKRQLAGRLPALDLPTDRPRPPAQTFRGATYVHSFPKPLSDAALALSRREGATLFITMLAAFDALLHRYTGQDDILIGTPIANRNRTETEGLIGLFANTLVLRSGRDAAGNPTFRELLSNVRAMALEAYAHQDLPFEQLVEELQPERDLSRNPLFQVMFALQNAPMPSAAPAGLSTRPMDMDSGTAKFDVWLSVVEGADELLTTWEYNTDLFDAATIARMAEHYQTLLAGATADPDRRLDDLPLLTEAEQRRLLVEWNDTARDYPVESCLHQLVEAQAAKSPDTMAVVFNDEHLTYGALDCRANQLAHYLGELGVGPEACAGVCLHRSLELVVGLLGTLKAGGAYVPLDPSYPRERLAYMLTDSGARVVLTQRSLVDLLASHAAQTICLDTDWPAIPAPLRSRGYDLHSPFSILHSPTSSNLAYVIYTSGSTGQPKGVMVEHRNVVNFLAGMDSCIRSDPPDTWLAVTSVSFDISILELFWTLAHGFRVILHGETGVTRADAPRRATSDRPIDFSLFYFASDEGESKGDKYRLLLEGAKFADEHGFAAVWTPERHFHAFGGLYPNPSVIGGALASLTRRVHIRAGSVVLPIHNPIRVAEEWAVVDNLSNGRVGLSFAPGWHANDFVFAPEQYPDRKGVMLREIETVRRLWRGESIAFRGGAGNEVGVKIFPHPIQSELPYWITAAGNPETFRLAGEAGANLLTHLLGQSLEDLAGKIAIYRAAWREHGHGPGDGHVTLMLHTFVGDDLDTVREIVRKPFCNYLKSSLDLLRNLARGLGQNIDAENFSEADMDALLAHAFDRYFETSGLMGTPEICLKIVDRLKAIGVDEVACLIDFGVETEAVLASLGVLNLVRERSQATRETAIEGLSLTEQIARHKVSHLQCTPSLARLLLAEPNAPQAIGSLRQIVLGGEALPHAVAAQLGEAVTGEIWNMYGPTETTVWSTACAIDPAGRVTIGRPIANTALYVLDRHLQPVPIGAPGELHIGGAGVARGYLNRPDLTAERFIPNLFTPPMPPPSPTGGDTGGGRLYKTGDLVRYLPDGRLEYLGRLDHQVKLHGHRIEPGEIEATLTRHSGVREVVVAAKGASGDQRLIAYVVPALGQALAESDLRKFAKERLPAYMLPAAYVLLDALPLTPNGKVDRRALPAPDRARPKRENVFVAPRTPIERRLAGVWADVLGVESIGIHDNFFERGGDSILTLQVLARCTQLGLRLSLSQLFQYQTIADLAPIVGTGPAVELQAEQGLVTGEQLLMPFQRWFFDLNLVEPDYWNQWVLLEVAQRLDPALLDQVVRHLLMHHDALRARFVRSDEAASSRRQIIAAPGDATPFVHVDMSEVPEEQRAQAIEAAAVEIQASLNLSSGPVIRVGLFDLGPKRSCRLMLAIHHLVVDGVSWRILLGDLQTAYAQLSRGQAIQLSPKTTSLQQWAERLKGHVRAGAFQSELAYWLDARQMQARPLPLDFSERRAENLHGSLHIAPVSLTAEETQTLLQTILAAYKVQIIDVLLTALALAFARWTGSRSLLLHLEGHGRESIFDDVDLTRTVGWLATFFPVVLDVDESQSPIEALRAVQDQLRRLPNRGLGYGLLRYLNDDVEVVERMRALPRAEVRFNYLGQFDQVLPESSPFTTASEFGGSERSPRGLRPYLIEINGMIAGGRLELGWAFSQNLYRRSTIERAAHDFIEALRSIIRLAS